VGEARLTELSEARLIELGEAASLGPALALLHINDAARRPVATRLAHDNVVLGMCKLCGMGSSGPAVLIPVKLIAVGSAQHAQASIDACRARGCGLLALGSIVAGLFRVIRARGELRIARALRPGRHRRNARRGDEEQQ
jgi:hypothetical protein